MQSSNPNSNIIIIHGSIDVEKLIIPKSVTQMEFASDYTSSYLPFIPQRIETLILPDRFNDDFTTFNPNMKIIVLGKQFNRQIDSLVYCFPNLERIVFGEKFDKPLNPLAYLHNLISLRLGKNFNQSISPLEHCESLKRLYLEGKEFDKPISALRNSKNLTMLVLGKGFSHTLNQLPLSLEEVIIHPGNKALNHPSLLRNISKLPEIKKCIIPQRILDEQLNTSLKPYERISPYEVIFKQAPRSDINVAIPKIITMGNSGLAERTSRKRLYNAINSIKAEEVAKKHERLAETESNLEHSLSQNASNETLDAAGVLMSLLSKKL